MQKITIAIDGYSSTGKSTVAKQLAKYLGYAYVDTGAMYRAVTLFAMNKGFIDKVHCNENALVESLENIKIHFEFNSELGFAEVYLNGENVEAKIRTMEVSSFVSQVATVSEIRKELVKQQQIMGRHKGVVMDGRDIGTVVFPNAELKIFMTASAEKRAARRYDELRERGNLVTIEEVIENVRMRDDIDTNREDSPLRKAEDAVVVDNSDTTEEEQLEIVKKLAMERIKKVG
ncbi:cytidylate kinase [Flavobacteriaceae bacterium MAR_2010_188]|nr:cytidylate kinase [Flavobacteriaceae bacterium MAR_2010_188]